MEKTLRTSGNGEDYDSQNASLPGLVLLLLPNDQALRAPLRPHWSAFPSVKVERAGRNGAPRKTHFPPPLGEASKREEDIALDWTVFREAEPANQTVHILPETPPLPRGNFCWREKFGSFRAGPGSSETVRGALKQVVPS